MTIIKVTQVMVVKENHGDSYYLLHDDKDYIRVLTMLAKVRLSLHYYEGPTSNVEQTDLFVDTSSPKEKITAILAMDHNNAGFANEIHHFMSDRAHEGCEYEGWELERFEEIKND